MNYKKHQSTVKWVDQQLDYINPYTDKTMAYCYNTGFLSSILAILINDDSQALAKFKLAVIEAKRKHT